MVCIAEQTNQFGGTKLCNTPCARLWINTTIDEIKAFVGVLIMLMGLLKLSRLEFIGPLANLTLSHLEYQRPCL